MESISVKVPVTVKAKLTEKLKARIVEELNGALEQIDLELKQLDIEEQKVIREEGASNLQQLQAIRQHFAMERQKRQDFKEETESRLSDTNKLALGAEIVQGQLEHITELKVGDNIRELMNVEILVEDDKIIAIRA